MINNTLLENEVPPQKQKLTGQIQANPNTVHIMHRIFPVKPFEKTRSPRRSKRNF